MTPSETGLIEAADAAAKLAGERAAEAEEERRLSEDVIAALIEAGFARHFVPAGHGGYEATFTELRQALLTLGRSCASASWCALILATSGRMAAYLPPEGQAEVWRRGPDAAIAAALVPSGTAEAAPGGWRLSGEWNFLSAVDFSDWALLCVGVPGGPSFFAVPRDAFRVKKTWFNLGMRGTGSNSVVAQDVFVPHHRSVPWSTLLQGGSEHSDAICHQTPLAAVAGPLFATPALGSARAMLRAWTGTMLAKTEGSLPPPAQQTLARAGAELDAADLVTERALDMADLGGCTPETAARNARDASLAAELTRATANRLFESGGSQAQRDTSVLQRQWRDILTSTSHAALRFDLTSGMYAKTVGA
ncbi:hydrolase [Spongiactinospora gelatinilytica]|uniref:Hydrolase n=1 Tax=Spongiactinospora gelatinilytica TaxID=2666298 RepID=A0A2W2GUP9_9ACTN|nr:acyl-CoA dehydrogenase family protein [Spongiactinospora gelatinilytica]PZG53366.1 hydrolase [Spongiactinospora gelatinilytica]